jgi:hypothetical protein
MLSSFLPFSFEDFTLLLFSDYWDLNVALKHLFLERTEPRLSAAYKQSLARPASRGILERLRLRPRCSPPASRALAVI